ncbi:MAG: hypothetical protein ACI9X4_002570 [Glaciecola sp.]|jgi:hypothetical protein
MAPRLYAQPSPRPRPPRFLDRRLGRGFEFGVEFRSAGIREVLLPDEMKSIMNQAIKAQ